MKRDSSGRFASKDPNRPPRPKSKRFIEPSGEQLDHERSLYGQRKPLDGPELNTLLRWAQAVADSKPRPTRAEMFVVRLLHAGYQPAGTTHRHRVGTETVSVPGVPGSRG